MAGAADVAHRRDGDGHMVPLLSLKLILLAFFILLNALSEFETEKTSAVLDSVNRAFRGKLQTPRDATSETGSLGVLPLPGTLLTEVGSLFESFVPAARARRSERATTMRVEMPAEALFRPGEDRIRPEREVLVRRLARALMRDPGGILKYELAFLHGVPRVKGSAPPGAEPALKVRRGAAVADYLVRQAIPPDALSIGLLPERPDTVVFVLRMRPEVAETPRAPGPDAAPAAAGSKRGGQ